MKNEYVSPVYALYENQSTVAKNIINSIVIALLLTSFSYGVAFGFGWIDAVNWLEFSAVATSYSCTWLCVVQSRWNYVFGAISVVLLCYLFYTTGLFASAALNAYLVPTLIYGWFRWRHDTVTRPVTSLLKDGPYWITIYILGTIAVYILSVQFLTYLGGSMAWMDSLIFILSIIAQFMLDNKKLENWIVWMVINVVAIYVYFTQGLYIVAIQYVFFLANAVYAYYVWNFSKDKANV